MGEIAASSDSTWCFGGDRERESSRPRAPLTVRPAITKNRTDAAQMGARDFALPLLATSDARRHPRRLRTQSAQGGLVVHQTAFRIWGSAVLWASSSRRAALWLSAELEWFAREGRMRARERGSYAHAREGGACACERRVPKEWPPRFHPKNVHQPWPLALKSHKRADRATGRP